MEMASLPEGVAVVEDIHGVLQVYSDGTIFRADHINFPFQIHEDPSVVWKDCCFDHNHNLHLRLYKPAAPAPVASANKLPILYFIHGGGFCVGSRTFPNNHNACLRLASGLQALVVAPDYRLAPEHRLPAAADDSLACLEWLQAQALSETSWLSRDQVDFGRVYIIGDSSGGNIAHHLAVQLGPGSPELAPLSVRGYVLIAPFFGGMDRTKSEAEGAPEPFLNLELLDRFWRLCLPTGKNRDHPLANPFGPLSRNLDTVTMDPMLVMVGVKELMRDRVEEYARKLREAGKKVYYAEFDGEFHGVFTNDPYSELGNRVLQEISDFIFKISG